MTMRRAPAAPWWGIALVLLAALYLGRLQGYTAGLQAGLRAASTLDYIPPRTVLGDVGSFLAGFAACRNTYNVGAGQ